jgi:hypothetical protein
MFPIGPAGFGLMQELVGNAEKCLGYLSNYKKMFTDIKNATSAIGLNGTLGAKGVGLTATVQIASDSKNNVGFLLNSGAGVMIPELSAAIQGTASSADTIYDLAGLALDLEVGVGSGGAISVATSLMESGDVSLSVKPAVAAGPIITGGITVSETIVLGVNIDTIKKDAGIFMENAQGVLSGDRAIKNIFQGLKNPFGFSAGTK